MFNSRALALCFIPLPLLLLPRSTGTLQSLHNGEKNKQKTTFPNSYSWCNALLRRKNDKEFLFLSIDIDVMSLLARTKQLSNNVTNRHFKMNETTQAAVKPSPALHDEDRHARPRVRACVCFSYEQERTLLLLLWPQADSINGATQNSCWKAGWQSRDEASVNGALTGSRAVKPPELSTTRVSWWALSFPAVTGRVRIAERKES